MFPHSRPVSRARSPAQVTFLALVMVLLTCGGLLYVLRDGVPSRAQLAALLSLLALTPVLLRWQSGWLILFAVLPWISFLRRAYVVLNPAARSTEDFDLLILLPDAIVVVSIVGYFLTRFLRKKEPQDEDEGPLLIGLGLLIGLCAIEVFNPYMASVAAGANGLRIFTLYVGLYWVTRLVAGKPTMAYAWLAMTVYFGAITGLYGSYQYVFGFPWYDKLWAETGFAKFQTIGEQIRPFSTFSFTSTFSHYMVIAVAAAVGGVRLNGLGRATRMLAPLLALAAFSGILFSFVRSSFVGVLVAVIVGGIVSGEPKSRGRRVMLVFGVGALLLFAMPGSRHESQVFEPPSTTSELVSERMLSVRDPSKVETFNTRVAMWMKITEGCTTTFPIGVGLGAGQAPRFGGDQNAAAFAYTESQFFSAMAEMGWPGFGLFCFVTAYGFLYSLRTYDKLEDPERKAIVLTCMMMQVGILVAGLTGGAILYTLPGSAYYWSALGMVAAMSRAQRLEKWQAELTSGGPPPPFSEIARGRQRLRY